MKTGICAYFVSFLPPNISTKKVETVVHVCSLDWWVSHHRASCLVKVFTRIYSHPCSPRFLETCSISKIGDSLSLYLGFCLILVFVGVKVGYSLVFPSNIFGMMETEKH